MLLKKKKKQEKRKADLFDNVFTDSPKKYTKKSTNAKSNPQPKHI